MGFIPVQSTAKARRLNKMRGRLPSYPGRPRLNTKVSVKIGLGTQNEVEYVRYKLPSGKQRKVSAEHSLNQAVLLNRQCSKK